MSIKRVHAHYIYDSRGNPTVAVDLETDKGFYLFSESLNFNFKDFSKLLFLVELRLASMRRLNFVMVIRLFIMGRECLKLLTTSILR